MVSQGKMTAMDVCLGWSYVIQQHAKNYKPKTCNCMCIVMIVQKKSNIKEQLLWSYISCMYINCPLYLITKILKKEMAHH